MSIDDGMGGECRVCGGYHLDTDSTICMECLLEALISAERESSSNQDILAIIFNKLCGNLDKGTLYDDALINYNHLKFILSKPEQKES